MPKISTYANASSPISGADKLIGTDANDYSMTKNFLISDLFAYFTSGSTLQGILDNGNTAVDQSITLSGSSLISSPAGIFESLTTSTLYVSGNFLDSTNVQGTSNDVLLSTGSGVKWNTMARGFFYSAVSQSAALANTAYAMTFSNPDTSITSGTSISLNSHINVAVAGVYNIQFSAQFDRVSGSGTETVDIWFRKNGVDIPASNTKITMTGNANASKTVAAWNFMTQLAANDYIQIMWATTSTAIQLIYEAATSPHPATPSVIATINRIP